MHLTNSVSYHRSMMDCMFHDGISPFDSIPQRSRDDGTSPPNANQFITSILRKAYRLIQRNGLLDGFAYEGLCLTSYHSMLRWTSKRLRLSKYHSYFTVGLHSSYRSDTGTRNKSSIGRNEPSTVIFGLERFKRGVLQRNNSYDGKTG